MKTAPVIFTTLLATALSAAAQLDTNHNGMGDVWERHFNNGQLFWPGFLPADDTDDDGQSNLMEAIAGTDPLAFDPPQGHFVQTIRHVPATWYQDPEEEEPTLYSPEVFEVEWHGVAGKKYVLYFSTDLAPQSWIMVGQPIETYFEGSIYFGFFPSEVEGDIPEKLFWRVEASDIDSDGDSLTDYEERLLGTNPYNPETVPGIPDAWIAIHFVSLGDFDPQADDDLDELSNFEEFLHGTNPKVADTDGDGTSDFDEVNQGSAPTDASDNGEVPSDPLKEVEFQVGGDLASWRMEIHGKGPRDNRKLRLASPIHGATEARSFKLRKNNRYEITLHRTGGEENWYCWETAVEGKPGAATFEQEGYQLDGRNAAGHFFVVAGHWLVDNRPGLLTSHLDSENVDVPSPLKAELVPVAIEDDAFATGVDIVSNSVASDAPGYQDKLWIMAPIDGGLPPAGNLMKFDIPLNPPAELQIECEKAVPDPDTITLDNTKPEVLWRGTGDNETSDNTPGFKIGVHEDQVDLSIGVKTMKYREVKVVVHYVTGAQWNPIAEEFINLKPPATQVTAQQIKDTLNEIFGRQINAWFNNLEIASHTIDWDIGVTSNWGTESSPIVGNAILPNNGFFDKGGNADDDINNPIARPEEAKLLTLIDPQANVDMHVFLIGGCQGVRSHIGVAGIFDFDDISKPGMADRRRNVVFVATEDEHAGAIPQQEFLYVIAHEIGHLIVGSGHPDQGEGPAPLPGTIHDERLMYSNVELKEIVGSLHKNLLVKEEWDAAEAIFRAREIAREQQGGGP